MKFLIPEAAGAAWSLTLYTQCYTLEATAPALVCGKSHTLVTAVCILTPVQACRFTAGSLRNAGM